MMEAFSDAEGAWRFLPSQVLAEEDALMADLLQWRALSWKVRKEYQDQ